MNPENVAPSQQTSGQTTPATPFTPPTPTYREPLVDQAPQVQPEIVAEPAPIIPQYEPAPVEPPVAPTIPVTPVQTAPVYQNTAPVSTPAYRGNTSYTPYTPQVPLNKFGGPVEFAHKKRKWPWVLLVFIIILLGGAGALYAFYVAPSIAIPRALTGVGSLTKNHWNLKVKVQSSNQQLNGTEFSIITNIQKTGSDAHDVGTMVNVSSTAMGTASLDVRRINDVLYFNLVSVPASIASYVSSFSNKWFSLKMNSVKDLSSKYKVTKLDETTTMKSMDSIYQSLLDKGIIKDVRFTGVALEAGAYVRKYRMTIDKSVLEAAAKEKAAATSAGSAADQYVSRVESLYDSVEFSPIVISVDLISGNLRSVSLSVVSNTASSQTGSSNQPVTLLVSFSQTPESFKSIELPSDVTPLDEMVKAYMSGMFASSTLPVVKTK